MKIQPKKIAARILYYRYIFSYLFYHKLIFGINNTKFDISYCVFVESFIKDQYEIRRFLSNCREINKMFFLDVGRNHGFVFYYMIWYLSRTNSKPIHIDYVGIDPSPLKFVYFNDLKTLANKKITINYRLIDRAYVSSGDKIVKLKYGENNFGNFNVEGSNYSERLKNMQTAFECIDIEVETLGLEEIFNLIREHKASDTCAIKIDCKNETSALFLSVLKELESCGFVQQLVSCEKDFSVSEDQLKPYLGNHPNTLVSMKF